jgi:hypothetical protein
MSSSQLTKSIIFQRGRLNHQPVIVWIFYGIEMDFSLETMNQKLSFLKPWKVMGDKFALE